MWKYIDTKAENGSVLHGKDGEAQARAFFEVRDSKCPVVETTVPGKFAVWCAAPLSDADDYPQIHHKPKDPEDAAKFSYVKAG